MQRPVIKGIRLRLSLALVLVVAGVLAVVYLTVVPSLETELVNAKLDQLEEDARKIALDYQTNRSADQDFAAQAGALFSARVVIYTKLESIVLIHGDSSTTDSRDVERDPMVLEAAANGKLHRGTVERDGRLFAEVALPAGPGAVVLVSDSLADPLSSLHLIERRLFDRGRDRASVRDRGGVCAGDDACSPDQAARARSRADCRRNLRRACRGHRSG